MTFEITSIIGNSFGEYQFKIRHKDSEVLKRVKSEVAKAMRERGYNINILKGHLEKE
jgi:uncharacterized protein (UPF0297 family)